MSTGTCSGACCAAFPVAVAERLFANPARFKDGPYMVDMLRPITWDAMEARFAALDLTVPPIWREHTDDPLFTCRHWDSDTRLCTAYETRPDMCSRYPYGNECERGCGFSNADDLFDWKQWRWDARAHGYRSRPPSEYTRDPYTNEHWSWDGEVLRPHPDENWRWDARWNRWRRTNG